MSCVNRNIHFKWWVNFSTGYDFRIAHIMHNLCRYRTYFLMTQVVSKSNFFLSSLSYTSLKFMSIGFHRMQVKKLVPAAVAAVTRSFYWSSTNINFTLICPVFVKNWVLISHKLHIMSLEFTCLIFKVNYRLTFLEYFTWYGAYS